MSSPFVERRLLPAAGEVSKDQPAQIGSERLSPGGLAKLAVLSIGEARSDGVSLLLRCRFSGTP
jgi:hypothetical protein